MEQNYNINDWTEPCPKYDCRKAACKCGLKYVNIPMSLGDDSAESSVAPKNGAYCNALVFYEANEHVYIYTQEGVPTLIDVDASDISTLEQEVIKAQRDVHELREDIDKFAYSFDTVADMKAFTKFGVGGYAKTLGFYSLNDGGGAYYRIRSKANDETADNMFIIQIDNFSLVAELMVVDNINVKQLGAYGDNIHNDTNVFRAAFSKKTNTEIYVPSGIFRVTEELTLPTYTVLRGNGNSSTIRWARGGDPTDEYIINVPITSKRCVIKDIRLDGNLRGNGIYDGKNKDSNGFTSLSILNVTMVLCRIGIYLNSMGSTVDNVYVGGNNTNDNSGGCLIGIYVNETDTRISNARITGFSQYGIYNLKDGTRLTNVKSFLNGVGCYFRGIEISASVLEAQENFYDNFKLYQVHGSNFQITSGGAGTEDRNGQPWPLPTVLNDYAHLNIEECDSTTIRGVFDYRAAYGTRDWSCEGYIVKLKNSIGIRIEGSAFRINNSTALPKMVEADNIAGNTVIINGFEYFNELEKKDITLQRTVNCELNYQHGDNYSITMSPDASGGIGIVIFDYFECNRIAIYNMMSEGLLLTNINFRYKANGEYYYVRLEPSFIGYIGGSISAYRLVADIADILANDSTYQDFISQGIAITEKTILLVGFAGPGSVISSREDIKGFIQVYGD